MAVTETLNIQQPIVDGFAAGTYSTAQTNSTWLDMGKYEQLRFVIDAGAFGTSATLDATLNQATTSTGGGSKTISGSALTQATASGWYEITVKASSLDTNGGFHFVNCTVTPATATVSCSLTVHAADVRTSPQTTTAKQSVVV